MTPKIRTLPWNPQFRWIEDGTDRLVYPELRTVPWTPQFKWCSELATAADEINSYHEDYPRYVESTKAAMIPQRLSVPGCTYLRALHEWIFGLTKNHTWRSVDVRIGDHRPPAHADVALLMRDLDIPYIEGFKAHRLSSLEAWYQDFETIHPFEDGNGRVGGVVVAMFSHLWFPDKGYYTVLQ